MREQVKIHLSEFDDGFRNLIVVDDCVRGGGLICVKHHSTTIDVNFVKSLNA